MKKIFSFLKNVISSSNEASSKRLVLLITILSIILIAFLNMFFKLDITEFIFSGLLTIVLTCLGVVSIENVSNIIGNKFNKNEKEKES